MARNNNKLEFSGYTASTNFASRPGRDRSRSPKRPRIDSWRPSDSGECEPGRHEGRRRRGKARKRTENEYRERSPNPSYDARTRAKHMQSHEEANSQIGGTETKGLSNRIHSLRRLLQKATDMPADIRQEKERELQGYMTDQQRRQARREKNAVTSRYHFVRFMERKKAERRLKHLGQNFNTVVMNAESTQIPSTASGTRNGRVGYETEAYVCVCGDPQSTSLTERRALQQQGYGRLLHEAKVDLNYTLYAPLDQKYISLYPSSSKRENPQSKKGGGKLGPDHATSVNDDEAGIFRNDSGQKPPLWYEVEKAMANDNLEALRDGQIVKADHQGEQALTFRSAAEQANVKRVHGSEKDSSGEDEESEDGFFE
jgi:rRNA-processing protein Efg1